jgi:hypothetical protein
MEVAGSNCQSCCETSRKQNLWTWSYIVLPLIGLLKHCSIAWLHLLAAMLYFYF